MVLNDVFSLDKGSVFVKYVGSMLLMSNFSPNIELFRAYGSIFMWLVGLVTGVVAAIQGFKNLKRTDLENAKLKLENEQLEKRQVVRQLTDTTYAEIEPTTKLNLDNEDSEKQGI
jgi:cell shape-determining protein MreC